MKIPLRSIVARKVCTIALERSAKKAVMRHATNAIYGMGTLKIPLRIIRSKEGPHYCSARKLSEDKRQSTLFTSLDILWCFHTRAILRSLANARKCQLEDFCEKEKYESCSVRRTFKADAFRKVRKGKKLACSYATTRFPRASCFEKPSCSVPETLGRMYDVLALRN
jgi:hypothetical protein